MTSTSPTPIAAANAALNPIAVANAAPNPIAAATHTADNPAVPTDAAAAVLTANALAANVTPLDYLVIEKITALPKTLYKQINISL
ncbi:hypothetical protein OCS_04171 [Ophiocordyceps sinensis CO18]|uniref:Uncharacterized protein n=1 Tax=Ophiocordyceps sinensis (strain Co18 / CGMCC 3.14243) TaxID=911162 RepID=T5AEH8_OPHSC|nr:hypothetical protein OCS_04171 [Ophiocordyceps sinensis CO18]